jgi:imidazolonepropionase-like amidohydrolase
MPRKLKIIFCFLLPLVALHSQPQEAKTLVLKSARLYDGKSDRMMSPGLVVVRGDRIDIVGSRTAIPPGSVVIDLGDATLLPGFIDAHTHLGWAYAASYDQREMERMRKSSAELGLDASVWVRKTLMAGFTAVRDLGSTDFIDIALRNAIRDGAIPGRGCWSRSEELEQPADTPTISPGIGTICSAASQASKMAWLTALSRSGKRCGG